MQNYHGDVHSNGAIYKSLLYKKDLGVKKEFHLYSLISNHEIRQCPDSCHNKLAKSCETYADTCY